MFRPYEMMGVLAECVAARGITGAHAVVSEDERIIMCLNNPLKRSQRDGFGAK